MTGVHARMVLYRHSPVLSNRLVSLHMTRDQEFVHPLVPSPEFYDRFDFCIQSWSTGHIDVQFHWSVSEKNVAFSRVSHIGHVPWRKV